MKNDLPYAVQWSEGLLLSPQHMQQSDRYWQAHLRYLAARANPDFWGVRALQLDDGLLEKGTVTVRALECVLDDGTPIVLDADRDAPLSFDAAAELKQPGDRCRVAIVLPVRGDAAAAPGSLNRRYDSLPGLSAPDENTGTNPVSIARLRPMTRLQAGWPTADMFAGCPLLEIERTPLGAFRRTAYHPPLAVVAASSFLQNDALRLRVERLRDAVRRKLRETAQSGQSYQSVHTESDAFLGLAARQLSAILPMLDVLAPAADVAPRDLYLALAQMVGALAAFDAFRGAPNPPVLPPYDHVDCKPGFDAALGYLEDQLDGVQPAYERLPFERVAPNEFTRALPEDAGNLLLIEVIPAAAQQRADLERWFAGCRIGRQSLLPDLENRRLPGAAARPLSLATRAELKGLNPTSLYFEIVNTELDFADGLHPLFAGGQTLAIRGSTHAHPPAGIVLYRATRPGSSPTPAPAQPADAPPGGSAGGGDGGR